MDMNSTVPMNQSQAYKIQFAPPLRSKTEYVIAHPLKSLHKVWSFQNWFFDFETNDSKIWRIC